MQKAAELRMSKGRKICENDSFFSVKKRTKEILAILDARYGTDAGATLDYGNAWQLLFATILSAQCTDARVNLVTKDLYKKYTNLEAFANADLHEMEQDIKSTGFYHNKAKNIIACARALLDRFDGEVPSDIGRPQTLSGEMYTIFRL